MPPHKRMRDMLERGEPLPVDLRDRAIYYVGPVDPVAGETVGQRARRRPTAWTSSCQP